MGQELRDIGEHALIGLLSQRMQQNSQVVVGVGDDAAVVRIGSEDIVLCTDAMVEGVHFMREWSTPAQLGGKIVARNLADIAAMGALPTGFTLSLTAPATTDVDWVLALVDGVNAECARAGIAFLGGDTTAGDGVVLVGSGLGEMRGMSPLLRSGAQPGDVLAVHGHLGCAAAGLMQLKRGDEAGACVEAQLLPQPDYSAARAAATAATSMIDTSDGLVIDAGHIAKSSSVDIDISRADTPVLSCVRAVAAECGVDVWHWVLGGGEDHAFLATFPDETSVPPGFTVIGRVSPGDGQVTIDGQAWTHSPGFEHFASGDPRLLG